MDEYKGLSSLPELLRLSDKNRAKSNKISNSHCILS